MVDFRRRYEEIFSEKAVARGKILVVIPAHNEGEIIEETLTRLFQAESDLDMEVAIVCDNCDDRTAEVATSFCEKRDKKTARVSENEINPEASPDVTVIERQGNPGKTAAVLSTKAIIEGRDEIPEYTFVLDADTRVPPDYVRELKDTLDGDENKVAASGRINFSTEGDQPLGTFSEVINNIHGVEKCGGDWIPGGSSFCRTRNFYAGYEMIREHYPDSMVEDVTWKVMNNLAGFETITRKDLAFDTLAPTGSEGVQAQMERWLGGLAQVKSAFGETLQDFGLDSRLERIVVRQIVATLAASETLSDLAQNIQKLIEQIPTIKDYLQVTLSSKGKEMGEEEAFSWKPSR